MAEFQLIVLILLGAISLNLSIIGVIIANKFSENSKLSLIITIIGYASATLVISKIVVLVNG